MKMSNFTLQTFLVAVDVCGQRYYAADQAANVTADPSEAFQFHKGGAEWFAGKHFPNEPTEVVSREICLELLPTTGE